jgi:hypothetical protein
MILSLGAVEAWRDRPDWSGPVEQHASAPAGLIRFLVGQQCGAGLLGDLDRDTLLH